MASARRRMRRIALTPLIDVIFLLLLFFMLSSTFSRFGEVVLSAGGGGAVVPGQDRPAFVQLGPDRVTLNADPVEIAALPARLTENETATVLISLRGPVNAQRLTDLLVALGQVPGLRVTVLGEG